MKFECAKSDRLLGKFKKNKMKIYCIVSSSGDLPKVKAFT